LQDGYKPAEDFVRISEYFTGRENTRGATMLRSQPSHREGYYYFLRTQSAVAVAGARLELSYITPLEAVPKQVSFTFDLPAGNHVTQVGLTGADWVSKKEHPVAWQLRLLAPDGTDLLTHASFLWAKPVGTGTTASAGADAAPVSVKGS
jgi:hypothetical protein